MFVPEPFKEDRLPVLHEAIRTAHLATLVTAGPDGLTASHVPVLLDDSGPYGTLLGHISRANPQWRETSPEIEALTIFTGPDAYISPSWYPSKRETGKVVPTWNYLTVHAYGDLVVHDDPRWTADVVRRLTAKHEDDYSVDDVPADYVERMLRAVVGVEVRLTRVEAKAKMSQNRRPDDVRGIVAGLRHEGGDVAEPTADWMEQHAVPAAERRAALLADVARSRGRESGANPTS
jgi:transcriptional regulator